MPVNPETRKAYARAYREANRDHLRVKAAELRHADPEKQRAVQRAYYQRNRAKIRRYQNQEREKRRAADVLRKYGLSPEQQARLMAFQDGACAICHRLLDGRKQAAPHVDHEHGGEVRGLLCNHCNQGLGQFLDNPAFLRAAIEYLASPPARAILGLRPVQLKLVDELA